MIEQMVRAEDYYGNLVYVIRENGEWRFIDKSCHSLSLSNFTSNAAELYIALNTNSEDTIINILKKHADYLKIVGDKNG